MSNLIMLIAKGGCKFITSLDLPDSLRCLYWDDYPFESLPSNFCTENLVELHLPFSKVKKLCKEGTAVEMLSKCTAVEMLPSSIENLNGLPSSIGNLNRHQDLNLSGCCQLKDVPKSIYSLISLRRLNFWGCRRLENLPSSSVGFLSLEVLELSCSGIMEIPASIKQASRLSILKLTCCQRLQSIPELPVLCNVAAQGCTSLKIVSSSRTALTQGWDKPKYCFKVFTNCLKLENNSRSNIMDEAQITVMRMATVAPLKDHRWFRDPWIHNPWPQINISCPGKEIPNWFSYQNEGSSVGLELRPDWFRTGLFGFALSVVVSRVPKNQLFSTTSWVSANFIVKFMGESHELFSSKYIIKGHYNTQHLVLVWNEAFRSEEVGKNCSPDVYKLAKEASVVFCLVDCTGRSEGEGFNIRLPSASDLKVESCGICPLYAEDAEKFKLGHVFMSRGPKVEEETKQDEPQASGSCDESEANESDDHGSEVGGTEDDSSDESEANESD